MDEECVKAHELALRLVFRCIEHPVPVQVLANRISEALASIGLSEQPAELVDAVLAAWLLGNEFRVCEFMQPYLRKYYGRSEYRNLCAPTLFQDKLWLTYCNPDTEVSPVLFKDVFGYLFRRNNPAEKLSVVTVITGGQEHIRAEYRQSKQTWFKVGVPVRRAGKKVTAHWHAVPKHELCTVRLLVSLKSIGKRFIQFNEPHGPCLSIVHGWKDPVPPHATVVWQDMVLKDCVEAKSTCPDSTVRYSDHVTEWRVELPLRDRLEAECRVYQDKVEQFLYDLRCYLNSFTQPYISVSGFKFKVHWNGASPARVQLYSRNLHVHKVLRRVFERCAQLVLGFTSVECTVKHTTVASLTGSAPGYHIQGKPWTDKILQGIKGINLCVTAEDIRAAELHDTLAEDQRKVRYAFEKYGTLDCFGFGARCRFEQLTRIIRELRARGPAATVLPITKSAYEYRRPKGQRLISFSNRKLMADQDLYMLMTDLEEGLVTLGINDPFMRYNRCEEWSYSTFDFTDLRRVGMRLSNNDEHRLTSVAVIRIDPRHPLFANSVGYSAVHPITITKVLGLTDLGTLELVLSGGCQQIKRIMRNCEALLRVTDTAYFELLYCDVPTTAVIVKEPRWCRIGEPNGMTEPNNVSPLLAQWLLESGRVHNTSGFVFALCTSKHEPTLDWLVNKSGLPLPDGQVLTAMLNNAAGLVHEWCGSLYWWKENAGHCLRNAYDE